MSSPRHEAARNWAAAGIPVFPCVPGGKRPATVRGFKDATTDLEQIDAWWSEADYNLAVEPDRGGWAVVDPDGPEGVDQWKAGGGTMDTYRVRTPGGGYHLYFAGTLPPSAGRLASHVDTRGRGSYVLLPPSMVDGKEYVVEDDRDPEPLPAWVPEKLALRDREAAAAPDGVELDTPAAIGRARAAIAAAPSAIEGEHGDETTYKLCATIADLGISEEKAFDLLQDWNAGCIPPWPDEDLEAKIASGYKNRQNAVGAHAIIGTGMDTFAAAVAALPAVPEPEYKGKFRFYSGPALICPVEQDWLVPGLIPAQSLVMLAGPKGSFKTYASLAIGAGIAAGLPVFGLTPVKQGQVFFAAAEGPARLRGARIPAWMAQNGLTEPPADLHVCDAVPVVSFDEFDEFMGQVATFCKERKPALLILDTLARVMTGLEESSAKDAGIVIETLDRVRRDFRTAIMVPHHFGKDGAKRARGSSALPAGMDTVIEIERQGKSPLAELRVMNHRDAEEPEPIWLEGKTLAGELVLQVTERRAAAEPEEIVFEKPYLLATLRAAGIVGPDRALTCTQMAELLLAHRATASQEGTQEWKDKIGSAARQLGAIGRRLHYGEMVGGVFKFFLPAPTPAR